MAVRYNCGNDKVFRKKMRQFLIFGQTVGIDLSAAAQEILFLCCGGIQAAI